MTDRDWERYVLDRVEVKDGDVTLYFRGNKEPWSIREFNEDAPLRLLYEAGYEAALRDFADHDLHGLVPHSEIANRWYHAGLDAAQDEARAWAEGE